jgi:type I restriction enzyme S subunit
MSDWQETTLGYFLNFQRGFDITKKQMIEDGIYDVIFSSGIGGKHNEYKIEAHGVVIGRKGTLGTVFYSENRFWATDTTLWVKDFHGNYPKFAYYFLKTLNLGQYDCGSANPTLNRNHIHLLNIKIPVLAEEQKRIADILSCLDAKIENLRRQNETLEEIAQTLFKHWFIDFEFPNADGKPYKSSGGVMVPSELGDIPEGWRVGNLGDFGKIVTGKTPSTKLEELWGRDCYFVTPTDFKNYTKFILYSDRLISNKAKEEFKKYIIPRNSVIVTCIGSDMGKVAINEIFCMTNQQINSIIPNLIKNSSEYIYHYLLSQYQLLRNIALGGSTMPIINKSQFSEIEIIIPQQKIIDDFSTMTNSINSKVITNEKQIQTLTKIRNSLLPKLMSGQIRVKE